MNRRHTLFRSFLTIWLITVTAILAYAEATPMTALGIDVDFYIGPISHDV